MRKLVVLYLFFMVFMSGCSLITEHNGDSLCEGSLSECEGKVVQFEAKFADEVFQHMIDTELPYERMFYADSDRFGQLVVYSNVVTDECDGMILTGTVIKIEGQTKRPGSDELYAERQLIAEDIVCMP